MAFLTFRGGVHPYDGKELSKEKPITDYAPGKELVYPLSQHIGAPAKPVVKKGDHVLAGQIIIFIQVKRIRMRLLLKMMSNMKVYRIR